MKARNSAMVPHNVLHHGIANVLSNLLYSTSSWLHRAHQKQLTLTMIYMKEGTTYIYIACFPCQT